MQAKAAELAPGKELWHVKENLGSLLWDDIRPALGDSVMSERLNTMQAELFPTCNQPGDIVGVFPVGGSLAEAQLFDICFRPCLSAFRAHTLFKQHISPASKLPGGQIQAWIPLSLADSKKKRNRQGSAPQQTRPKSAAKPEREQSRPRHRDTRRK